MGPLLRWFVFNVAFGLLPFVFSVLLRLLHGEPPELVQNAPELLFLSLMLSAVQMGEAFGDGVAPARASRSPGGLWSAVFCAFLLVAITSAVVYGLYVQARRESVGADPTRWVTFQSNVFSLSVVLAVVVVAGGTGAELARTWRER
jgi:hypothetical protein